MPKEQIQISSFRGFYPAADSRDLPDDAPSYVENVDFVAGEPGSLMGLPQDTEQIAAGFNGGKIVVPIQDGNEYIYHDGTGISSLDLSSFTITQESATEAVASGDEASLASDGEAVHVGRGAHADNNPRWVGYIDFGQFGGSAPSGIQVEDAELKALNNTETAYGVISISQGTADDDGAVKAHRRYFYTLSAVYDGFQESPLQVDFDVDSARQFNSVSNNYTHLTVTVKITNFADLSPRISAINLYRAETPDGGSEAPASEYTLVKSIDINDSGWTTVDTTDKSISIQDDYIAGRSFERGTDLPETLEHLQLHYGLSCVSEGFHIVGNVWHPGMKALPTYLFRSKLERFDTFDWSSDYLKLPSEPVALVSFMGQVWAFCEGKIYRISPSGFGIEEEYEGIGAASRRSVVVTDRGMFFASDRNLYWHDGGQIYPIGEPVFKNDEKAAVGYLARDTSIKPVVLYDSTRDLALFCFNGSDDNNYAWAFHVTSRTWMSVITLSSGSIQGGFVSTDGRPFVIIGGALDEVFASSSNRSWEWRSKEFHDGGLPFTVYHARIKDDPLAAGSNVDLKYIEDGGVTNLEGERTHKGGSIYEYEVNTGSSGNWTNVRTFQLQLTGDGNDRVKDVTLIQRRRSAR